MGKPACNTTFNVPENLFYALKSLYRYNKLVEMQAPSILIETESDILLGRLHLLTDDDIDAMALLYPEFANEREIQETIENLSLDQELEKEMISLN